MVVIVDKGGDSVIMTSCHHARRSLFDVELLLVLGFVGSIGRKAADHFLIFSKTNTLPLQDLDVLEAGQDLVLHDKDGLHSILAAFLDGEWLVFEGFKRAGC